MDSLKIYRQAKSLIRRCGTRDPEQIVKCLGIMLLYEDSFTNLLGMYTYRWKTRIMVLNPNLDDPLKKMVLAHELGHDQCHRDMARKGLPLQEISLFKTKSTTEYEANAFAAHLLIDTDEFLALAKEGYCCSQIAKQMSVDINLLLIKTQELNRLGFELHMPLETDGEFLKKIKGSQLERTDD